MKIYIKKHLIQEGVVQGISNNWGKLMIAGLGIAAAHSGVMGPEAQKNIDQGGNNLKGFLDKMGDKSKQMGDFYKDKIDSGKDHLNNGIDHAKDFGTNIINKSKDITTNLTNQHNNSTNLSNQRNDERDISTRTTETPIKNFDAHNNHIDQEQFNNTANELSKHFGA